MSGQLVEEMRGPITRPEILLKQVLAGNSILTMQSKRSQRRFTFKFRRPDEDHTQGAFKPVWVSVLGGPQGSFLAGPPDIKRRCWSFLGTFWPEQAEGPRYIFKPSHKSKVAQADATMVAAAWFVNLVTCPQVILEQADVWHEGRCGRCGRRLTVPESIDTGFGPECRRAVGL